MTDSVAPAGRKIESGTKPAALSDSPTAKSHGRLNRSRVGMARRGRTGYSMGVKEKPLPRHEGSGFGNEESALFSNPHITVETDWLPIRKSTDHPWGDFR